jgi:hypothetical protein
MAANKRNQFRFQLLMQPKTFCYFENKYKVFNIGTRIVLETDLALEAGASHNAKSALQQTEPQMLFIVEIRIS